MTFSEALVKIKQNKRLYREGWNAKGQWIELQEPDGKSKMTLPYIYMKTKNGGLVPWLASQTDLLDDDWWVC